MTLFIVIGKIWLSSLIVGCAIAIVGATMIVGLDFLKDIWN